MITGRNEEKLNKVLAEFDTNQVKGMVWDLNNVTIATEMLIKVHSLFGRLDIAINNAGVWTPKPWEQIEEKDWDVMLDTNTKGLFFICQAEANLFKQTKEVNKIINITSMVGQVITIDGVMSLL